MTTRTTSDVARGTAVPRAARLAVFAIFVINGFVSANWFVRIPAIQERLDLSTASLGLILLGLPAGAIVAMPIAGTIVPRFGSRHMTEIGTVAVCLILCSLGFASSAPVLFALLALFGAFNAVMDIAMNAQGVAVEKQYGRSIMLSLHGGFSAGGMAGALFGGLVASQSVAPGPHLLGVGLACAVAVLVVRHWLLPAHVDAASGNEPHLIINVPRPVVVLGLIAFCGLLAEGSMSDWTAVYLKNTVGTGAGQAALGYAVFSLTMTVGRLTGDRVTDRFGGARVVRMGGAVAAVGLLTAMSVVSPWAALLGFALVGIGIATIAPIVYSTAGRTPGIAPGTAIAAATTIGYTGFLAGPPIIGVIAGVVTLRGAFGVVVALMVVMVLLAGSVDRAEALR